MVNCLSQSVSQIYKNGNIYGLDGVYEGAQAMVPLWQIRYPSRTADGTRLVCQEFLTLERVVMLHVTILCLIFGAIVTTFTPKSRASVELQDAHRRSRGRRRRDSELRLRKRNECPISEKIV